MKIQIEKDSIDEKIYRLLQAFELGSNIDWKKFEKLVNQKKVSKDENRRDTLTNDNF